MPKGRDPKISLYLLIFIVDIKKVYNFGQLKNEGVKDLPESQLFALKGSNLSVKHQLSETHESSELCEPNLKQFLIPNNTLREYIMNRSEFVKNKLS